MKVSFQIRNAYFCGTTYWSVGAEFAFLQMPLIVAGLLCLGFSSKLGILVWQMKMKKMSKHVGGSGGKKAPKAKKDKSLQALAVSMLRLAFVCVVCIFLYVITVLLLLPDMRERASEIVCVQCARLCCGAQSETRSHLVLVQASPPCYTRRPRIQRSVSILITNNPRHANVTLPPHAHNAIIRAGFLDQLRPHRHRPGMRYGRRYIEM